MAGEALLEVRNLTKRFGGVTALDDVSFELREGETLGIIGPNGSGKTTLLNAITGFVKPSAGTVVFKGKAITQMPPHKIVNMGIARTFQIMRPFYSMASYKNLVIALYSPRVAKTRGGKLGDRKSVALDILEEIGFERDAQVPYKMASALPLGYLKRLEIARCLALRPELIACDEVFSGLSMAEIASMVPLMQRLQVQGKTIIMIEHRLRELFQVVDRVVVLHFGRKIAEGAPSDVLENELVQKVYLG